MSQAPCQTIRELSLRDRCRTAWINASQQHHADEFGQTASIAVIPLAW